MKNKQRGMTLVELIAVIAIMGIVSGLIASMFSSSNSLFTRAHNQTILQDEVRLIASAIEEDGKTGISKDVSYTGSSVAYSIPDSTAVNYELGSISSEIVEIIFACRKNNEDYIYVLIGNDAQPKKLMKYKGNPDTGRISEVATLGNFVESVVVDKSSIPYKLKVLVKDSRGNSEGVDSLITPRN